MDTAMRRGASVTSPLRRKRRHTHHLLLLLLGLVAATGAIAAARAAHPNAASAAAASSLSADDNLETWLDGEDEDAFGGSAMDTNDEVEEAAAALAAAGARDATTAAAAAAAAPSSSPPPRRPPASRAPPPPPPPTERERRAALADAKKRQTAAAHRAAAPPQPTAPLVLMKQHEATVWFYVLVGLVMTSLMIGVKETGAALLLQGATVLRIQDPSAAGGGGGGGAPDAGSDAGARRRRDAASSRLRAAAAAGFRQKAQTADVWLQQLPLSTIAQLEFKEALDLVLLYAAVAVGVAASAGLMQRLGGLVPNSLPAIAQACTIGYVLGELLKAELLHEAVGKNDRAAYLVSAVVGAAAAGAVLVAIPPGRLTDFDAGAGGYAAGLQLHETIQQRMQGAGGAGGGAGNSSSGVGVGGGVGGGSGAAAGAAAAAAAAAAGGEGGMLLAEEGLPGVAAWAPCLMAAALLSGGLMAPGMRYGRALTQALHPPQWARSTTGGPPSRLASAAVRLSFAAPLVVVALWFPPLTDALGMGRGFAETGAAMAALPADAVDEKERMAARLRALALARGLCVACAGLLQLAAARPLVQAFLHTGLYAWYQLRHFGVDGVDPRRVQSLTLRQVRGALALGAKCGLQMSAPAAVLLPCGALLLLRGAADPFVSCAAGFVAWWTCLTWSFYAGLSVLLARLGSAGGIVNVA